MADDPLDEISHLPIETQVAVIISVLRSTRNQLGRIERKLEWVNRATWTLVLTIVAGIVVYSLTTGHAQAPPASAPTPSASIAASRNP